MIIYYYPERAREIYTVFTELGASNLISAWGVNILQSKSAVNYATCGPDITYDANTSLLNFSNIKGVCLPHHLPDHLLYT